MEFVIEHVMADSFWSWREHHLPIHAATSTQYYISLKSKLFSVLKKADRFSKKRTKLFYTCGRCWQVVFFQMCFIKIKIGLSNWWSLFAGGRYLEVFVRSGLTMPFNISKNVCTIHYTNSISTLNSLN